MEGQSYEEVESFVYLGIELQRNGQYTRHLKRNARKANRRATEVWSLAERLFPNNFRIRRQMFEALVKPIMLYGAEVTGYIQCEEYEKIQRRYYKWSLGLPANTRNEVLVREAGLAAIFSSSTSRAAKFENGIEERSSALLRKAYKEQRGSTSTSRWTLARAKRFNELGWGKEEAEHEFTSNSGFWKVVRLRVDDIWKQIAESRTRAVAWYLGPKEELPIYLRSGNADMKLIARFRCGAESRGNHAWRKDMECRRCGSGPETLQHQADCLGMSKEELLAEDGSGAPKMRLYIL